MGEPEECQPHPGEPLVDLPGEDIANYPKNNKTQAIKEKNVIQLSLQKGGRFNVFGPDAGSLAAYTKYFSTLG